jgi:hypothetical protein
MSTTYYISQGQTRVHKGTIPSGTTVLTLLLNWGNTNSKLSLSPYTAGGNYLGTYYDQNDPEGINGKISLRISSPGGVEPGVWMFKIKGVTVSGREDFTFDAYTQH